MAMLRWTVEFAVDESWVADGFDLTDERAKEMLATDLGYAYGHELGAKVLKYPSAERVARLQGYSDRNKNPDYSVKAGVLAVEKTRKDGRIRRERLTNAQLHGTDGARALGLEPSATAQP